MKGGAPSNERCTHLKIHPQDNVATLDSVYKKDPKTHIARRNPETDLQEPWGADVTNDMSQVLRQLQAQHLYGTYPYELSPEAQWAEQRKEMKLAEMEAYKKQAGAERIARDMIISVEMWRMKPKFSRTIRVSGNMTFSAFSDKILVPAIGFTRNYHCYYFSDERDGAVFMPQKSGAIDVTHKFICSLHASIDDTKVKIGEIFREVGDTMLYVYDLGDHWRMLLTVQQFCAETTGKVELIAGELDSPPEDSNSLPTAANRGWKEFLALKTTSPARYKASLMESQQQSWNLKDRKNYDPMVFDIEDARKRIAEALASSASTQSGKLFVHETGLGSKFPKISSDSRHEELGKGELDPFSPFPTAEGEKRIDTRTSSGSFMTESIRTEKDPKEIALCACCGKPDKDLLRCSACKKVRYCSRECQKTHWKQHKKKLC
eukprot:TRINITY_DN6617_c0_g1_i1.p1 TRINITY_DN6617_c0_g1~~TRINITY_DN6617_c0_g1_i1.p1  ORF type:complete len:482 (-),score=90.69 TRINITY_DN6617_c0_g1_i1:91-1389(-)